MYVMTEESKHVFDVAFYFFNVLKDHSKAFSALYSLDIYIIFIMNALLQQCIMYSNSTKLRVTVGGNNFVYFTYSHCMY